MTKGEDRMWTHFWDMHSGGGLKEEPYAHIYIEAPQAEAEIVFYNRFGHNPNRVSCACCGEDYSISEEDSLEQLTAFQRGCRFIDNKAGYAEEHCGKSHRSYVILDAYLAQDDVLAIYAKDIKPEERIGLVPEQGHVWID